MGVRKKPEIYYFKIEDPETEKLVKERVEVLRVNKRGDQYRISKEEAERLLRKWKYNLPFEIMCKEYGQGQDEVAPNDWVGVYCDDLRDENEEEDPDNGKFPDYLKKFEIWDDTFLRKEKQEA